MNQVIKKAEKIIDANFRFGINKRMEILRLIYEICKRNLLTPEALFEDRRIAGVLLDANLSNLDKFKKIKSILLEIRFPITTKYGEKIKVYLNKVPSVEGIKIFNPQKEFKPEKVYYEKVIADNDMVNRAKGLFLDVPFEQIKSLKDFVAQQSAVSTDTLGKKTLFFTQQKNGFIKKCPCSKKVVRCNYNILNIGFGCPFDCSYCYLQHYTNCPGIILPVNTENVVPQINDFLNSKNKSGMRIGTGEFTDSLALDHITHYSLSLVDFFSNKDIFLELKTKSNNIKNILKQKPAKNIVISWSLNPRKIIEKEELATASLKERLVSAQKCLLHGYSVGFHFDPIFFYENWKEDYKTVIEEMFEHTKGDIAWVSLGTFRFNPALKAISEQRFPESKIMYGELLIGEDGKLRYHKNIRIEMYKFVLSLLRKVNSKIPVYLCMETEDVCKAVGKLDYLW